MRIGIDLGGTKMASVALSDAGDVLAHSRIPTPQDYEAILNGCAQLAEKMESEAGQKGTLGLCMPGAVDAKAGCVRFSPNVPALAGKNIVADMESRHGRTVRIANDAACFALSESADGAGAGMARIYGVILGTGVGGSLATGGAFVSGPNAMQEWGHVPLPFADEKDHPARCGCGRMGCVESYLSGPALHRQVEETFGRSFTNKELMELIAAEHPTVMPAIDLYCTRLAKAFAMLILVFDPDALVLGGGVSNLDILYREVPKRIGRYTVVPEIRTKILKAKFGDDSGMRGAAWLWS